MLSADQTGEFEIRLSGETKGLFREKDIFQSFDGRKISWSAIIGIT